jgi:diacylglycerol kinase family enzyme
MSVNIGIITNPHSKLNKRNPQIINRLRSLTGSHCDLHITESLAHLDHVAQGLYRKPLEVLAICGGDGTISRTITALIKSFGSKQPLPKLAILKGGTINLVASQLQQKNSFRGNVNRLIQLSNKQNPCHAKSIKTIEIDGNFGFLYADGSHVSLLEEFYRNKTGLVGASWIALKLVGSFLTRGPYIDRLITPKTIQITAPTQSKTIELESLGNLVGTISKLPLGFPLMPFARENPELFQFTSITSPQEKLLWQLPSIMLKHKKGSSLGKHTLTTNEMSISTSDPFSYTIDGEIYQSNGRVDIKTGPSLDFVRL